MLQTPPRRWSRRGVLRVAIALTVAAPASAVGILTLRRSADAPPPEGDRPSPTLPAPSEARSSRTPASTPTATSTPSLTPTPPPPATSEFRPANVGNGETALLIVHATEPRGQVRFLGQTIPLRRQGNLLWTPLGIPIDAAPGPLTAEVTLLDADGRTTQRIVAAAMAVFVERPVDYLVVTEEIQSLLTPEALATEARLRAKEFATSDAIVRWEKPFIQPTPGPVSTQFGAGRSVNGGPVGDRHSGADIANDQGTPVVAAAPARVAFVEDQPIRGLSVILDHGAGVKSGYHHLEAALVKPDDLVEAGTPIGRMGSSGYSTGPHLHWEVTVYGVNVDPFTWTVETFRP